MDLAREVVYNIPLELFLLYVSSKNPLKLSSNDLCESLVFLGLPLEILQQFRQLPPYGC